MKSTTHPVSGTVTLNGRLIAYTATVERGEDGAMWVSQSYWTSPGVLIDEFEAAELQRLIVEDALYTATH